MNRTATIAPNRASTSGLEWKGRQVPPLLAGWFDQLMEQRDLIMTGSALHYIDVTLTAASAGNYAKPPQILFK